MSVETNPVVWSIAGSDCSGGAGLQADNQVFRSFGLPFGNIVTAVTAQNSQGVQKIALMSEDLLMAQWHSLAAEMPADVIKIGMIGDSNLVDVIVECLAGFEGLVVCDPVLVATSGGVLMQHEASYHRLLHKVDVITPNRYEFTQLFNKEVSALGIEQAVLVISKKYQLCVILTGGDNTDHQHAIDFMACNNQLLKLSSPFMNTHHTHGTGCSLSAAMASALALGYSKNDAFILAKSYINQGLRLPNMTERAPAAFQHSHFPNQLSSLPHVGDTPTDTEGFQSINEPLGLYAIVDSLDWLGTCLEYGVNTLQLRLKDLPDSTIEPIIAKAIAMAKNHNTPLFINDYWQLAIKHNAFGVHLGQEDLATADILAIKKAGLHLGISTHNWYEIAIAHSFKPSYIAFGPIYPTQTKKLAHHTIDLKTLQSWVELLQNHYALTAIGGIGTNNAKAVLATGIGSVAVIGAIKHAENPEATIVQLNAMLK